MSPRRWVTARKPHGDRKGYLLETPLIIETDGTHMKKSLKDLLKNFQTFAVVALAAVMLAGCASEEEYADDGMGVDGAAAGNDWSSTSEGNVPADRTFGKGDSFNPDTDLDMETFRAQTVYFDYDRSSIRAGERAKLEAVATYMKANPDANLYVIGHCDQRGTLEYNRALGERRANAARDYLGGLGIAGTRVGTLSYGSERPADNGTNEDAYAKNRRAEFGIVKK